MGKIHLVYGGSGSGKSEYAENLSVRLQKEDRTSSDATLWYVATMYPYDMDGHIDEEVKHRIARHRMQRSDKGMMTVECYLDFEKLDAKAEDVVLLECTSNLLANILYRSEKKPKNPTQHILSMLQKLSLQVSHLIVVSNDIFSDGIGLCQDEETFRYVKALADIHRWLAKEATTVTEVCCGIPIFIKE